jgi:5-aminolevulinate synthase
VGLKTRVYGPVFILVGMTNYNTIFIDSINSVKSEGRYRTFTDLEYIETKSPTAFSKRLGKNVTVWCSNDYLGMSRHPVVINAMVEATKKYGTGAGGTRNISGNNKFVVDLESSLADLHQKEAGLVFTSGYVANQATLSTLAKIIPNIVMFSDELNHASMIHGVREGKCDKQVFRHSDTKHLEELLKNYPLSQPKLILFESVYSMLGDIAPIKEYIALAKKYNALTYIDEVHSVGLYGDNGAGISQMLDLRSEIDIIQGTLAKAYGVIGGYVTGSRNFIDAVRCNAPGFIFTTALPPSVAAAALASIEHLKRSLVERQNHQAVVNLVKAQLRDRKVNFVDHNTHIIPVMIGDPRKAQAISEALLYDFGIYIQHINYPTVPRGKERLRITPTPLHSKEMLDHLVSSLAELLSKNEVKLVA